MLQIEDTQAVRVFLAGGSALDDVPTVDEHDYDEEVRKKAGEVNP